MSSSAEITSDAIPSHGQNPDFDDETLKGMENINNIDERNSLQEH